MVHANPKIKPVSQIIDPTAFPRARSGAPWNAASTETTASGKVVPIDTIVAPTITLGIPVLIETVTAPSTNESALFPSIKILTKITAAAIPIRPSIQRSIGPTSCADVAFSASSDA